MKPPSHNHADEEFVLEMISCQPRLRGFLRCLLVEPDKIDDLLQETNRVLLRKSDRFRPGTDFWAWACQVARFEVMAHHRNRQRERNLFLDPELIEDLATQAESQLGEQSDREHALRACLQELGQRQIELVKSRYEQGKSIDEIADTLERPVGSIRQTLYRIRQQLRQCIERRLAGGAL